MIPPLVARAAQLLCQSQNAVALTGAGISTPSGIPDFRSPSSGLWENVDPMEVASLTAFRYHPERFFNWVRPLAAAIRHARPNEAHYALAALETAGIIKLTVTQNIDELHLRAGSRQVIEIHGHWREAVCMHCHRRWPGEPILEAFLADGQVPRCPTCGGALKPNVILMGEELHAEDLRAARAAARKADVMLVAGSSLEVMPCADLPREAQQHGAQLIIVNIGPTYLDDQAEVLIHADVAEILPQLAQACGVADHA
jgi:NAD-dependent deacetylase